jgi:YD repeat-containing protein
VRTAYDGLRKAVLDENGHMKVYEGDFLGRLTTVTECSGLYSAPAFTPSAYATTTYGYATLDWLTRVTDTLGNTTAITYDALGRKTGMWDPDMGAWSYTFDDAGNLETQTDAQGQVITFSYDFANRLTGKQYAPTAGMTNVTYTYDQGSLGKGLRTRMDDGSGYTLWSYDARGRVLTETKAISGTGGGSFKTQWTYNPRDLLATQVYPGGNGGQAGETVTTGYDKWGRPATLIGTSGNYVTGSAYEPRGDWTWYTLAAGCAPTMCTTRQPCRAAVCNGWRPARLVSPPPRSTWTTSMTALATSPASPTTTTRIRCSRSATMPWTAWLRRSPRVDRTPTRPKATTTTPLGT